MSEGKRRNDTILNIPSHIYLRFAASSTMSRVGPERFVMHLTDERTEIIYDAESFAPSHFLGHLD